MNETIDNIISGYSIEQLNDLIKKVEDEKERKKASEIVALRSQMVAMASKLGMKVEDIISYESQKKKTSGKPKYRNPADPEQTWTGRGKKPGWMRQALAGGAKPEDFAIPE
ncbi:MAG: H-NS histone family protein [Candidatus Competibacteraceae bacterium]